MLVRCYRCGIPGHRSNNRSEKPRSLGYVGEFHEEFYIKDPQNEGFDENNFAEEVEPNNGERVNIIL